MAASKENQRIPGLLGLLLILAFLLRLSSLSKFSLWLDEYTSIEVATKTLSEILHGVGFDSHTPPFYYLFLHFYLGAAQALGWGINEFTLRLPSVCFDIGALYLLYHYVARSFGKREAYYAAAFYTFLGFPLYFAQEGRMYSLLALLCMATLSLTESIFSKPSILKTFLLFLLTAAGLYTHYYYAFFTLGLGLAALLRYRERALKFVVIGFLLGGIAFVPWIQIVLKIASGGGQTFRPLSLQSIPYGVFRFLAGYSIFPLDSITKSDPSSALKANFLLLGFVTLLSGLLLAVGLNALRYRREVQKSQVLFILCTSTLLPLLISLKVPMFSERYLSGIFPLISLLFALALLRLRRIYRIVPVVLVVATVSTSLYTYFGGEPRFGKEQWREIGALISERYPDTRIVVEPEFTQPILQFYCSSCKIEDFKGWLRSPGPGILVVRGGGKLPEQGVSLEKLHEFTLESGITLFRMLPITGNDSLSTSQP